MRNGPADASDCAPGGNRVSFGLSAALVFRKADFDSEDAMQQSAPVPDPRLPDVPTSAPAELSAGSVDGVLAAIAAEIARIAQATRCAIFLYSDATRDLVLRAVAGAPESLIGSSRLSVGDGMAGAAFAERVSLHSTDIREEPGHIAAKEGFFLDDSCAEAAVPVLRGEEAVGVVVILRPVTAPFSDEELNLLRADIANHAGTLEIAKALYLVADQANVAKTSVDASARRTVHGRSVNDRAIAVGAASVVSRGRISDLFAAIRSRDTAPPSDPVRTFPEAVEFTIGELQRYQRQIGERLPEAAQLLFDAQILVLKDETFAGRIQKAVSDGDDPAHALASVALEFIDFFRRSGIDYLAEKADDVEDVAARLLHNLYHVGDDVESGPAEGTILFTSEFLPSDIFRVTHGGVRGIVLVGGASTAHVTLLVKSLGIPAILTENSDLLRIADGLPVILDGPTGNILVNPEPTVLRRFMDERDKSIGLRELRLSARPETRTRDGVRVHLLANINLLSEADAAMEAKAEGIGLYRTEFPFLLHPSLPNEADQLAVYGNLLDRTSGLPVTFRTLDAGGDKILSYFNAVREENPALGLRSTRFTLRYPYIFDQQLRAILRAAQLRRRENVRIMFPMIGSLEEFDAAAARVRHCVETLGTRYATDAPPPHPLVGTMVELPALVHLAGSLARKAAFFSIGTNDFVQYMLAADRTNAQVNRYYIPHHPAVLHGLERVAAAAVRAGIPVSVCGEIGQDPRFLPFFLGIGVRHFSLDPNRIPAVQEAIARIDMESAARLAAAALSSDSIDEIGGLLDRAAPLRA